jgi:hypothetical protein
MQIQPRVASQNFDLQQPPHPLPNGGGSSNGLEDREALTRTGKARAFPFEPPKLEAQTEKPQTMCGNCGFRRRTSTGFQTRSHFFCATRKYIQN